MSRAYGFEMLLGIEPAPPPQTHSERLDRAFWDAANALGSLELGSENAPEAIQGLSVYLGLLSEVETREHKRRLRRRTSTTKTKRAGSR